MKKEGKVFGEKKGDFPGNIKAINPQRKKRKQKID